VPDAPHDTWIDLIDPDPAAIAELGIDLHPTVAARLVAPTSSDDEPRARVALHAAYVWGILLAPRWVGDKLLFQEVDVIVTPHRLVTVRKTPEGGPPFDVAGDLRAALAGKQGPGMCLYTLVDDVAERFLDLIDDLADRVDALEDQIDADHTMLARNGIGDLRHDILRTRRILAPIRDAARSILDNRMELDHGTELFPRDVEIRFADAYDKLLRATDGLDLTRDLLAGVRDYHQAQIANDQNEVMKRLTAIASILLLPTFIVGLYGQNFIDIPELHWAQGYAWSWGLIGVTTIAQVLYFRHKRWI
jgi:magnesium transporter